MTPNWRLLVLAICVFGLAALAPLRRCHQRTVFAVRGEYAGRLPEHNQEHYRQACEEFIEELEDMLGDRLSLADIGVFPFVRQFSLDACT